MKVAVIEHTEYLFELLTLAFYNRCTMQESNCYEDPPTESIPVPTFFLEAVSDIVSLLSTANKENGDLKDEFWRELIEWGLSRTTYEAVFQNAPDTAAPISELLSQSSSVGKSPQIPSRLQMSNMEHEFRLLEDDMMMADSETGHEPSPGPNSIQDGITSSLKKDGDEPHMMGSDRSLRPVAARKSVQQFHIPYDHPYHMSGSKRKSTVPTKSARSPEIEVPSRSLDYSLSNIQPLKISLPRMNGHPSGTKVKKESAADNFNMPPAVPIPSARPSQDHIYQSEMLTKMIQPKTSRQSSVDTHSGMYQCLQCHNYGSSDLSVMKDHIREHLGLCPFQCYHCHRAFTCMRAFKAHADTLGIPYFQCVVCTWQTCDEADMHRHTQDEHLELPKCRREDLYELLHFYKIDSDLKSWDDYVGTGSSVGKQSGSSIGGKSRLETVMNGSAKK
ncbi:uncharacterized protein LOC129588484 [Paramacrobiotus metropolitanus]|uniref:uncharacterized protein LOC129588484 n=1 Tax=Paramacrobiotus metropolitanus TaxID=2943436 RepID=UPI0024458D3D|nr:uncharacterized protein LOC129588484 [Paramacrobiotus metropolitanus]